MQLDEDKLQVCTEEMRKLFASQRDYRQCLWDFRDDTIFAVEREMNYLAAEFSALGQFSNCMIAAGPYATIDDLNRCPVPDFAKE